MPSSIQGKTPLHHFTVASFLSLALSIQGCAQIETSENPIPSAAVKNSNPARSAPTPQVKVRKVAEQALKAQPKAEKKRVVSAFEASIRKAESEGQYTEIIAASKRRTQALPNDALGFYYLGVGNYYNGNFAPAVAAWKKAVALDPKLKPRVGSDQEHAAYLAERYPNLNLGSIRLVPSDRVEEQAATANRAKKLFLAKDYDAIERIALQMHTEKREGKDGISTFLRFVEGLHPEGRKEPGAPFDTIWKGALTQVQAWKKARPKSLLARQMEVDFQIDWAWAARGNAYADKVTEKQWAETEKHLKDAEKLIAQLPPSAIQSPYTGRSLLRWGQLTGLEKAEMQEIWANLGRHQSSLDVAYEWASYLLPRWGGEPGEWEKFASSWASRTPGIGGDMRYAQLLTLMQGYFDSRSYWFDNDLDWPRMKRGLKALVKKHPQSVSWATTLMRTSFENGDYTSAQDTLIHHIPNRASMSRFSSPQEFAQYRIAVLDAINIGPSKE